MKFSKERASEGRPSQHCCVFGTKPGSPLQFAVDKIWHEARVTPCTLLGMKLIMMTGVTIRAHLHEVIVGHLEVKVTYQRKPYAINSSQGAHLCEAAV